MEGKVGLAKVPPGKPRMSIVWQYFKAAEDDKSKVACQLCGERLKFSGSTTSMKYHLRRHASTLSFDIPLPPSKLKGTNRNGSKASTETRSKILTSNLVSLLALDYHHPSIVEGEGFRSLMRCLEPGYIVPSSQSLIRQISLMHEVYKYRLASELPGIHEVALGIERWTNSQDIIYMTITVNYITAEWEFQSRVLGTEPINDKLDNLAESILTVSKVYGIQEGNVVAVVHENDTDIPLSCALLGWHHFPCFARTLSNCVSGALEIPEVYEMVATCRSIINGIIVNSSLSAVFAIRQKGLGLPRRRLLLDIEGHWPSTWRMMDFAEEQHNALLQTFDEPMGADIATVSLPRFPSEDEWMQVKAVVDALRPLDTVREMLRTEPHVSLSTVVPILFSLVSVHLEPTVNDSELVQNLKKIIVQEMRAQFSFDSSAFTESFGIMATVLDPRHKSLPFLNDIQRNIVKAKLSTLVEENKPSNPTPMAEQPSSSEIVEANGSDDEGEVKKAKPTVAEFLSVIYDSGNNTQLQSIKEVNNEVDVYFQEESAPLTSNPLSWWKLNHYKYPILSKLARRMLCIPATAVRPSQAFSGAQHYSTRQRAALDPTLVDRFVFLNGYLQSGIMPIEKETELLQNLACFTQTSEVGLEETIEKDCN